ncbi:unnamed protein product [Arabis nemorensis]|uniref:NYN domain-containing protein n=1 Tax=Arabis nemorensis TaxID=586526 RepID=A0A565CFA3_9BRAS|nr:unnamed protein product [Arabis nemorensis]
MQREKRIWKTKTVVGDASQRLRKISIDMYSSALIHPNSVLMFVLGDVSRDVDFIEELCAMRAKGFGVFVCQPPDTSGLLYIPATKVWRWNSLAFGGTPIPDSERFRLSRVKYCHNYYLRRPQGKIDSDDEEVQEEEALESEEETTSSASHQSFPPEIKILNRTV